MSISWRPTTVVRVALENAVSVASVLLLTEATMTEIVEEQKEKTPEPGIWTVKGHAKPCHGIKRGPFTGLDMMAK